MFQKRTISIMYLRPFFPAITTLLVFLILILDHQVSILVKNITIFFKKN